jgi:Cytochrome c7 and related cytochrome c/Class III cytochrome C family
VRRAISFAASAAASLVLLYGQTLPPEKAPDNKLAPPPPTQPIPFSHKKHVALNLKCQECHSNPEPGEQITFPPVSKCMACHIAIAKDKPSIQKLAEFAKAKKEVPWVQVYRVPDFVYWSHRTHLNEKLKCDQCHGDVAEQDVMTKVTYVTTMGGCVACHNKSEGSTGCESCHPGKN